MRLAQGLAIKPDDKPWVPHLTLSRGVASHEVPPSLTDGALLLPAVPWSVESFHLVESRSVGGRRYQTLASWPLRAL
jgi:2'-5' RNA ligase